MILIDTCVLIKLPQVHLEPDADYGASIISRAELEFGILKAKDPTSASERIQRLAQFDRVFDWLPFGVPESRAYGYLAFHAKPNTGVRVRSKDALIAAQAYSIGASVMTDNKADFAPFAHLIPIISPGSN